MPWHLPQDVLKVLKHKYLTDPSALTAQEITLAKRVMTCQNCGKIWLRRKRSEPARCPGCHIFRFNTPLVDRLMAEANKPSLEATHATS